MPSVYVVQQRYSRGEDGQQRFHNYDSAFRFGAVSYLVPSKSTVDELFDGDVDKLLHERLRTFSSADFLILTGDPVICAKAVLMAVSMLPGEEESLKILKWDHHTSEYSPVEIKIPY